MTVSKSASNINSTYHSTIPLWLYAHLHASTHPSLHPFHIIHAPQYQYNPATPPAQPLALQDHQHVYRNITRDTRISSLPKQHQIPTTTNNPKLSLSSSTQISHLPPSTHSPSRSGTSNLLSPNLNPCNYCTPQKAQQENSKLSFAPPESPHIVPALTLVSNHVDPFGRPIRASLTPSPPPKTLKTRKRGDPLPRTALEHEARSEGRRRRGMRCVVVGWGIVHPA